MVRCEACSGFIAESARACPHCGHRRHVRASYGWLIVALPAGAFLAMLAAFGLRGGSAEESQAREAISHCWESVDDELAPMNARRIARETCQRMVHGLEAKYGQSGSLRRR